MYDFSDEANGCCSAPPNHGRLFAAISFIDYFEKGFFPFFYYALSVDVRKMRTRIDCFVPAGVRMRAGFVLSKVNFDLLSLAIAMWC